MSSSMNRHGVTIAITRYAEPDAVITQSLRHALRQEGVQGEVLFIEQGGSPLPPDEPQPHPHSCLHLRVIRRRLAGLSEARNLALEHARHPLVLFLDADAVADPSWARELAHVLSRPDCGVAGARVMPDWPGTPPGFVRSSVLRDQYSLLDLGDGIRPYHRVVGAGFGVDMGKLPQLRFDTQLGRRQGRLFGGEETDYCNRARELGFETLYVGTAMVTHLIAPERCRWRWILKRMIYAGHGRARVGGPPRVSARAGLYDWLYLPAYLPFYAWGWLWGKLT